jgi:hypothetical protein
MIRTQPWTHDGVEIRPLRVRERIALVERMSDRAAARAARDAKLVGLAGPAALAEIAKAREEAETASALVGRAFSIEGALEILAVATDDADSLAERVEPKTLTALALAAIGIDLEEAERRAATEGNA